ncbi:MAG: translational GTPase TypA [Patescibacteria group bacterium]
MQIRNIAIIAHVDHGKTTLVDALLRQTQTKLNKDAEARDLIMDSNDLEKERGITIFSKNASVQYGDIKINIIDTPGHADFGGEVERVLSMASGCLLVVDAKEGPMPQTRFVLKKALEMKQRIIVIVNKIDKPDARSDWALNQTFDLFVELGADDATLDFPVLYAATKLGLAGEESDLSKMTDITPIFDAIVKYIPEPKGDPEKPLQFLVTTIAADNFKGRIVTGRIHNGKIAAAQEVMLINREGAMKKYRITALMCFTGLERTDITSAIAGDIVAIAGIPEANIGETLADVENPVALPVLKIDEPTVKMTFMVNDSPFAGREGQFTTSRQIRERLMKELENDMALRVQDGTENNWVVSGRGELHLAILIERLRREGYELQVSRPQVITREENGKTMAPFEKAFIDVPDDYSGAVIQKLGARGGQMEEMKTDNGITQLVFLVPTQGLIGYRSEFLVDTRGLGIMNTLFDSYREANYKIQPRDNGSLVAHETGQTNSYGLLQVQDRGTLFFGPAVSIYKGQVVGQHIRSNDLSINVCKTKQLSNVRSAGSGVAEHVNAPKEMNLEDALEYIADDELVEITPKNIRIRKVILDEAEYRRKLSMGK